MVTSLVVVDKRRRKIKQQARGAHRDHQGLHRGTRRQRVAVRILVSLRVLAGFFLFKGSGLDGQWVISMFTGTMGRSV